MNKIRNFVAKHNKHRAVVMKVRVRYQRRPKHQKKLTNGMEN